MLLGDAGRSHSSKIEVINNFVVIVSAQVNNELAVFIICVDGVEIKELQCAVDCRECTRLPVKNMKCVSSRPVPLKTFIKRFVGRAANYQFPNDRYIGISIVTK